ncbi:ExbD/TolR family protein [Stieleria varia]|uniref:Biopolymer transport protein ExbD/TolR n=1 Tax=Stieleria varia TaxID=2528005 RepID=A0A5C6B7S2_9BACT|nr:biopolymer transporter ExbD [Stieleria varia]TWU08000.1 Biopolymer transport protein ExbD/TolR [Stieleria varia]
MQVPRFGSRVATTKGRPAKRNSAKGNSAREKSTQCDMTPMVDVTFLLLIFFMVTAAFSLQRAIAIENPETNLPSPNVVLTPPEPPQSMLLTVDEFGGFHLQSSDGERDIVGKQNLISELRGATAAIPAVSQLDVAVDPAAKLRWLVDAVDAGTIAGFERVRMVNAASDSNFNNPSTSADF